jgi:hypothetical protein
VRGESFKIKENKMAKKNKRNARVIVEEFLETEQEKVRNEPSKKTGNFKVGEKVHFKRHVFNGSYAPNYNEYAKHNFEVVALHYEDSHIELKCIDGDVKVKGYVHPTDLRRST